MGYRPTLFAGDHGPAVLAMQLALHTSLGEHAINKANGHYGVRSIHDVEQFEVGQRAKGHADLLISGRSFGPLDWTYIDHALRLKPICEKLLDRQYKIDQQIQADKRENVIRRGITSAAWWGYAHRMGIYYSQTRPFHQDLQTAHQLDCSGFATDCYQEGGGPDPNGFGFNGYGFTGTMYNRGKSVSYTELKPADLVFYGQHPTIPSAPGHVAVYVGHGMVISNGHYPMDWIPANYRTPRGMRSYL